MGGQALLGREKHCAALVQFRSVRRRCIVEPRLATHRKRNGSPDYRYHPNNFVRFCFAFNGHKVGQFSHSFFRKKSRNKDVCIRQIELTNAHVRQVWLDLKAASLFFIQQRSKYGWGIEVWMAKKVDGSVHAD